jgi:hypothetical protein
MFLDVVLSGFCGKMNSSFVKAEIGGIRAVGSVQCELIFCMPL